MRIVLLIAVLFCVGMTPAEEAEVRMLRNSIAALQAENAILKAELAALRPPASQPATQPALSPEEAVAQAEQAAATAAVNSKRQSVEQGVARAKKIVASIEDSIVDGVKKFDGHRYHYRTQADKDSALADAKLKLAKMELELKKLDAADHAGTGQ
jgi:hypothetical protein